MRPRFPLERRRPAWLPLLATTIALGLTPAPARADITLTVESVTASSNASGTTGSFDVTLTNTTGSAVTVGSFSFEVSVGASAPVTFTEATTATTTTPYIFAGESLFGPIINTTSGQSLMASDIDTSLSGATIANNTTVGLGNVAFQLTGTLTGSVSVTLSGYPAATSLTDPSLNNIPITTLVDGQISPASGPVSSTPEPSTFATVALGALAFTWYFVRCRRRSGRNPGGADR